MHESEEYVLIIGIESVGQLWQRLHDHHLGSITSPSPRSPSIARHSKDTKLGIHVYTSPLRMPYGSVLNLSRQMPFLTFIIFPIDRCVLEQ